MKLPAHLQHTSPEILNHGLVCYLFGIIEGQSLEIENLKAEVRLLKGHSAKPCIPPNSRLEGARREPKKGVKKNSF